MPGDRPTQERYFFEEYFFQHALDSARLPPKPRIAMVAVIALSSPSSTSPEQ